MHRKPILVEVAVNDHHGRRPLGIMSAKQALELPDLPTFAFSLPLDGDRVVTRGYIRAFA